MLTLHNVREYANDSTSLFTPYKSTSYTRHVHVHGQLYMYMDLYMCHANLYTHTIYLTSFVYTCLQSVNTCKHVDMYMLLADTITHPIYTGVESLHIVVYIIYSSQYVNTHL